MPTSGYNNNLMLLLLQDDQYYLRTGVRVLTICFGATDTGLIAVENMGSFDEVMEQRFSEAIAIYPVQK